MPRDVEIRRLKAKHDYISSADMEADRAKGVKSVDRKVGSGLSALGRLEQNRIALKGQRGGGTLKNSSRPIFVLAVSVLGFSLIFYLFVLHIVLGANVFDIASVWAVVSYLVPAYLVPAAAIGMALFTHSRIAILSVALLVCVFQGAYILNYVSAIADPIFRSYGWVRLWQPLSGLLSAILILPLYRWVRVGIRST